MTMTTTRPITRKTPFFDLLYQEIEALGGLFNAHLHLDRAGTFDQKYQQALGSDVADVSYISLHEKHHRITDIHQSAAYEEADLRERVNFYLDVMTEVGTRRADSLVDVTNDGLGLSALKIFLDIKEERASDIDLRIGAYSPLGNKDSEPERWELIEQSAELADFIALLPEADDTNEYPDHIGFYEHLRRGLLLGQKLQKMVHVHTDQRVIDSEDGTEQLVQAVREFGAPQMSDGEPAVWAVHAVSPTTYDEERFTRLARDLAELNIGVICCPTAALGMRQIRPRLTPSDNSMPRVLDLLAYGVQLRLASDNIADICSPSTTADLVDEVIVLSSAIRFYKPAILAKLACGKKLESSEIALIKQHLQFNAREVQKVVDL